MLDINVGALFSNSYDACAPTGIGGHRKPELPLLALITEQVCRTRAFGHSSGEAFTPKTGEALKAEGPLAVQESEVLQAAAGNSQP